MTRYNSMKSNLIKCNNFKKINKISKTDDIYFDVQKKLRPISININHYQSISMLFLLLNHVSDEINGVQMLKYDDNLKEFRDKQIYFSKYFARNIFKKSTRNPLVVCS